MRLSVTSKRRMTSIEAILEGLWGDYKHSKQPQIKLLVEVYVSLESCPYTVPHLFLLANPVWIALNKKKRARLWRARITFQYSASPD